VLKKTLLIIFSFLLLNCSNSSTPKVKRVGDKDIKIYYIHRDHCPGCEYMDAVFKTKEIQNILKNGYKLIVVDVNNQEALPSNLLKTRTTPTLYFVDNSNHKIAKEEHVLSPEQLKQKLLEIRDRK